MSFTQSFMDFIHALMGDTRRAGATKNALAQYPARVERVQVQTLAVHTANLFPDTDEKLIIVTTTTAALTALQQLRGPIQLTSKNAERAVTFTPSRPGVSPVLDPKHGWIIPVSPATAHELQQLPAGPGEYELESIHLGLILES